MVAEERRKAQLLELFSNITSKTKIVEPMKKIHGSLRDRDAVEREIALVMREVLDLGTFRIPHRGWFSQPKGIDMERQGAEPDVAVENPPGSRAAGESSPSRWTSRHRRCPRA